MKVEITQAQPEMQLATDVLDQKGRILARKGILLSQELITRLQHWEIEYVEVGAADEGACVTEEHILAGEKYLQPIFESTNLHFPANKTLYHIYLNTITQKIALGWEPTDIDSNYDLGSVRDDIFLKGEGNLESLIEHEVQMSSFSSIYFRIKHVLDSPLSSAQKVAEVISKDTTLTAKLLRLVNSPFYGLTSRIDSIQRAVSVIGTNELTTLALGISAIKTFATIPGDLANMKTFWFHSIACGVLTSQLAETCSGTKELKPETAFVGGILHEIGRLIMFKNLPQASIEAILFSRSNRIPINEAEQLIFGYDHAMIASSLLKKWHLPETLAEALHFQYAPDSSPFPEFSSMLNLANAMAMVIGYPSSGVAIMPTLSEKGWAILNLDPAVLEEMAVSAPKRVQEIADIFLN